MEQFDGLNFEGAPKEKIPSQPSAFQFAFTKMTGDMQFVGMFVIIYGALMCITIIGALVGVPMIFVGLRMREAAEQFNYFKMTNDPASMRNGFELQGKSLHIMKILIIISLICTVAYIILMIVFLSSFIGLFLSSSSGFSS
jgi:type III secretory pathway component EscU